MTSAVARVYEGVWGLCPQWGPGAKPLVGGSGGRSPPEADEISALLYLILELNLTLLTYLYSCTFV